MNLDKAYAESIAKEYMPQQTNKLRQLRKLDKKAKGPATKTIIVMETVGVLTFGAGMSFGMGALGSGTSALIIAGVLGIIGIGICLIGIPIHSKLLKKGKEKYSFEILELTKEILDENK